MTALVQLLDLISNIDTKQGAIKVDTMTAGSHQNVYNIVDFCSLIKCKSVR